MQPKGSTGLSYAEKKEKWVALQKRVDESLEHLKAKNIKKPDRSILNEWLDTKQLASLWQKMALALGKEPANIQQAWDGLKKLGSAAAKDETVATLVKMLSGDDVVPWTEYLLEVHDEATKLKTRRNTQRPLYRGDSK